MASVSYSSTAVLTMDTGFKFPYEDAGSANKRYSLPLSATPEPNPSFVFPPRDDSLPDIDMTKTDYPSTSFTNSEPSVSPSSDRVPNPPFSFAQAQAEALGSDEVPESNIRVPEHPSFSKSSAARHSHRHHAPPPLPAFSFNPSSPASANSSPTGSLVPSPGVPRNGGHRRRPSEFIGGDGKATSPGLMSKSVSPTRSDNPLSPPGPTLSPSGPPAGRRGHAHRRSAAVSISSVDLGAIKKTGTLPVNSGSNTPAYQSPDYNVTPGWSMSPTESDSSLTVEKTQLTQSRRGSAPENPRSRVVEFSDTVTVIPRPASVVSSDNGSVSALTRGHGVTDSISSIISSGAPSAQSSQTSLKMPDLDVMPEETQKPRPKTADPSLAAFGPSQWENQALGDNPQRKRPLTATDQANSMASVSPVLGSPLRKKLFGPSESEAGKASEDQLMSEGSSSPVLGPHVPQQLCVKQIRRKPSTEFKRGKKSRNVRNWAGSILSRKVKGRGGKQVGSRRTPTPPLLSRTVSAASSEVDFDDDNIVVLRDPNAKYDARQTPPIHTNSDWKPRSFYEQGWEEQRDSFSPVIDLDAALGPFKTPEMGRPGAGSSFSAVSKRMHSGGRRGEFVGPEMRYHRRAESAPEMPPIDRVAFGIHRLGSNSTMTDFEVFDEEEEDEFLASNSDAGAARNGSIDADDEEIGLGVSIVDSVEDATSIRSKQPSEMASIVESPAEEEPRESSIAEESSFHAEHSSGLSTPREKTEQEQLKENKHLSSGSTIVPSNNYDPDNRPSTAPIDFAYSFPLSPYAYSSGQSSTLPSPDPSSIYFDPPRSGTGSTSLTDGQTLPPSVHSVDRSASSILRPSNDDLRSIGSEASSNPAPRFADGTPKDRSASCSAPTPRRTGRRADPSKRGSIVSLSRLIGGSSGSSKLRNESTLNVDDDNDGNDSTPTTPNSTLMKRKSSSARHRLSRVFSFLKSDDKSSSK